MKYIQCEEPSCATGDNGSYNGAADDLTENNRKLIVSKAVFDPFSS